MHKLYKHVLICTFAFLGVPAIAATDGLNPNYLIVGADSIRDNDSDGRGDCDIKFQLSFSKLLSTESTLEMKPVKSFINFSGPLYFGYTQKSY